MTGRYPMRYGLQTLVIFPNHSYGLPTDERTLPQALKEAGYSTAMVGKWHLGHADRKYWPQNRGFDHFYGNLVGEVDYFTKMRGGIVDWQRDGKFLQEKRLLPAFDRRRCGPDDREAGQEQAVLPVLRVAGRRMRPTRRQKADEDRYASTITDPTRRTYAAMITSLDDQVGRIVAALDKRGMRENTLIIFSSDNGGAAQRGGRERCPLQGGAGSGRRQSGVAAGEQRRAPRRQGQPARGRRARADHLQLAGQAPAARRQRAAAHGGHHADRARAGRRQGEPADKPLDGKDIWATAAEGKPSPHDDILVNVEAFRGAIIKGKWKLVKIALLPGKTELFDLTSDPGEKNDVGEQNPEVVRDLESRLLAYAKQQKMSEWLKAQPDYLGAQGKTLFDPDFDIDDAGLPHLKPVLPKM